MKILKFDILYPQFYLDEVQNQELGLIQNMDLSAYIEWLYQQNMGYGDVISRGFISEGWEVLDFYNQDSVYLEKLKKKSGIKVSFFDFIFRKRRRDFFRFSLQELLGCFFSKKIRNLILNEVFIIRFIKYYNPDIIFLREPCGVRNVVFDYLKEKHFVVSLIGCNIPGLKKWQMDNSNLIFTLFPEYVKYFEANGIDSCLFEYGNFQLSEKKLEKVYDVTFVGVLATTVQKQKTIVMDKVAHSFDFKWWGVMGNLMNDFPVLKKSWQGHAAGTKMFDIYKSSKIILNDYPFNAKGGASNIRIKEVLSSGSLLLTRYSTDLDLLIEKKALVTFENEEQCLELIDYYLKNEIEREQIAQNGLELSKELFDSQKIMKRVNTIILEKYNQIK